MSKISGHVGVFSNSVSRKSCADYRIDETDSADDDDLNLY